MKDYSTARKTMVQRQLVGRGVRDPRVLAAMEEVPRHFFVDEALWNEAYDDSPLPIGEGQTISQPYMVAVMTELLHLDGEEESTGDRHRFGIPGRSAHEAMPVGLHHGET